MRRRCPAPLATALTGLLGLTAPLSATAQNSEHYSLRAELGLEYDSNAHRAETLTSQDVDNPPIVSSGVARSVVSATVTDVIAPGHALAASATLGGKLFTATDARSEDVAVAQSGLDWRMTLGTRGSLGLSGIYYEAFQRRESLGQETQRRDFRSLTSSLRLGRLLGDRAEAGLGIGYRLFVFKPDQSSDFQAPLVSLDLRWAAESADGSAEWELAAVGSFELRRFEGWRFVGCTPAPPATECLPTPVDDLRRDRFGYGRLDVTRTGRILLGAAYTFSWNDSNSYGETIIRHGAVARLALALPLALYLAARADVLFARYRDPVAVGRVTTGGKMFPNIEEENRSGLRVDLSRTLTDAVQLIARYSLYLNELGDSSGRFLRQTVLLSLAFGLEK